MNVNDNGFYRCRHVNDRSHSNLAVYKYMTELFTVNQDVYYTLCSLCASKYLQDIKVYYL